MELFMYYVKHNYDVMFNNYELKFYNYDIMLNKL